MTSNELKIIYIYIYFGGVHILLKILIIVESLISI